MNEAVTSLIKVGKACLPPECIFSFLLASRALGLNSRYSHCQITVLHSPQTVGCGSATQDILLDIPGATCPRTCNFHDDDDVDPLDN